MYLLTLLAGYSDCMSEKIKPTLTVRGFQVFKGLIDPAQQHQMLSDLRTLAKIAPLRTPVTPGGKQMSVRMTAAGKYGWYTDASGYRYIDRQPDGSAWPDIPGPVLEFWSMLVSTTRGPDCCLVNYYSDTAKMGLHQDKDEADFSWPVLSISLGDDARFRVGGTERGDKTDSFWLASGDVVIMGGDARLAYHGVDRIKCGTSRLLDKGGRINLTLRVVDA